MENFILLEEIGSDYAKLVEYDGVFLTPLRTWYTNLTKDPKMAKKMDAMKEPEAHKNKMSDKEHMKAFGKKKEHKKKK